MTAHRIWEIATIVIDPAERTAFEAAVQRAVPLFRDAPGCLGFGLQHVIEHPGQYRLVVEWESVAAHTDGFRNSPDFQEWRALAGPFFVSPPQVVHVEQAIAGF